MNVFDRTAFHDDDPATATPSISQLSQAGFEEFIIAIGTNATRASRFDEALRSGLRPAICVHQRLGSLPTHLSVLETVVMARAVVQSNARIGGTVLLTLARLVEHDCIIGDHTHPVPFGDTGRRGQHRRICSLGNRCDRAPWIEYRGQECNRRGSGCAPEDNPRM